MQKGTSSLPTLDPVPLGSKKKKKRLYTSKSSADFSPLPSLTRKVKKHKVKLSGLKSPPKGGNFLVPTRSKKINTKKNRTIGICDDTTVKKCHSVSKLTRIADHMGEARNKDSHEDVTKFWLGCISLMSRCRFFQIMSKPNDLNTSAALDIALKKGRAALFIVRFLREKSPWFHRRIARRVIFLRNHGWRLLLFWRCYKRKRAVLLLRKLFIDFSPFRLAYVMLRYRNNAVHLQRYIRSYVNITKARVKVLLMMWDNIEGDLRQNLIPSLLKGIQQEQAHRKRELEENQSWKKVKLDGVVFPQLAQKVNSATFATAKLKDILVSGEKRMTSLQRSLGKARAELIDPAVEERRRQRLYQKSLEEKRNGSETPVSPKKKPPKKMTQSVRENTLDLGLHPTPPISNRAREKLAYKFVRDIRKTHREIEKERQIIAHQKRIQGLSIEDVKNILTSDEAEKEYTDHIVNTGTKSQKCFVTLYTGQAGLQFRELVERCLKLEHGIPPDKYC